MLFYITKLITKVMCDLSVRLFGEAALRKTGVLPVIRSLSIRDLRTSYPLICESIDSKTVENNFQKGA